MSKLHEVVLSALLASTAAGLMAQQPPAPAAAPAAPTGVLEEQPRPVPEGEIPDDPWEAYDGGFYDRALQGFVDLEVEHPEDPEVQLNLGSSYYQMRDYTSADQAFATAAQASDPLIKAQALYSLGSSAFRQGRLGEAVEHFQSVLELTPDDEDAKFNLEFVRDEIRRRHEENQKRQEEQQQNGEQEQEQEGDGEQQEQNQQEQGDQGEGEPAPDADQDGLPDSIEKDGENPTDPQNPDTDSDGLPDGEEDQNRNGKVDEGETDPNRVDSDGDGIPDGAEQEASTQEAGEGEQEPQEGLTPEEAERYLQALGEDRPPTRPHTGAKKTRRGKDW